MTNFIQTITVENRQVDKENYFTIGYSPEIEKSLLCLYFLDCWLRTLLRVRGRRFGSL